MKTFTVTMLIMLNFSCATRTEPLAPKQVPLGAAVFLKIPPPACFKSSRQLRQRIEVTYLKEKKSLEALLRITDRRVQLIGLNSLGIEVFSLDYDGVDLKIEQLRPFAESFDPAFILADLSLAYAQSKCLAQHLSGPFAIAETSRFREIKEAGRPLIEIRYQNQDRLSGGLELKNLLRAYSYKIIFLEETPL